MKKQFIISLSIISFLIVTTIIVVFYARGYRFGKEKPFFSGTGLLVATSIPDGAQVFIDNHLTTGTDNTINLTPGEYNVRIFKDGYFPWEKQITIQKEIVSKADALLFPKAPSLENITASGVENPAIDPSLTKIAFTVSSQTLKKNGIYILDMSTRPILTLQGASTQITDDTVDKFSAARLSWSPDGKEIIASISGELGTTTYLLSSSSFNDSPKDITATLPSLESAWQKDKEAKDKSRINSLKPKLRKIIADSFNIITWSMEDTKILYYASQSATIPQIITPPLIGTNSTPDEREIKKDLVYVYDIKEDKNYRIDIGKWTNEDKDPYAHPPLIWYPDSEHLIHIKDRKIDVMDYDGKNRITVYAGPFVDNYVYPWPNTSKLVILTNLNNPDITPNLYTINLK